MRTRSRLKRDQEQRSAIPTVIVVVFLADEIEVPAGWSQVAADVARTEIFPESRRALRAASEASRGERRSLVFWWQGSVPRRGRGLSEAALPAAERYVSETSARQVFDRLAGAPGPTGAGSGRLFRRRRGCARLPRRDALHAGAASSPRPPRRNGSTPACNWTPMASMDRGRGHYYVRLADGRAGRRRSPPTSIYAAATPASSSRSPGRSRQRVAASWILWVREARLSQICWLRHRHQSSRRCAARTRSSGGGRFSGLMSFLKIGDQRGGRDQVRSGTTRRGGQRWSSSTSITPTSRRLSIGRCRRSRRSPHW